MHEKKKKTAATLTQIKNFFSQSDEISISGYPRRDKFEMEKNDTFVLILAMQNSIVLEFTLFAVNT